MKMSSLDASQNSLSFVTKIMQTKLCHKTRNANLPKRFKCTVRMYKPLFKNLSMNSCCEFQGFRQRKLKREITKKATGPVFIMVRSNNSYRSKGAGGLSKCQQMLLMGNVWPKCHKLLYWGKGLAKLSCEILSLQLT